MLKYTGKGFIIGVPARDLTDEEARRFDVNRLVQSGCYEQPKGKKSKKLEAAEPMEGEKYDTRD